MTNYVCMYMEDYQLHLIRQCDTAGQMWQNLQNYYDRKSLSNKVTVMRLDDNDDVMAHIGLMKDLFLKLQNVGENAFDVSQIVTII